MPSFGILGLHFCTPGAPWGTPFWHLGSALGSHFGVLEASWEAILAPRDHPGGPWEQQDGHGHEVARHRILVALGVMSGLVYVGFSGSEWSNIFLFLGLLLSHMFSDF